METLKKLLENENKKTFLDIGTGMGNFIHIIKSMYNDFEQIVGIDTSKRAIDAANKNNEDNRIKFEVMDAYHMTFPDNSFDVVLLSNSLHHLRDINPMLEEMARVMKDDGFIIINEMMADHLNKMQESHKLVHHFAAKIDRALGDTHNDTFTKDEILSILEKTSSLRIDTSWHIDVPKREETSQEELDYMYNILDRVASRAPEDQQEAFQKEKEDIKSYIQENGYDGCTSLLTILKTKSA